MNAKKRKEKIDQIEWTAAIEFALAIALPGFFMNYHNILPTFYQILVMISAIGLVVGGISNIKLIQFLKEGIVSWD